MSLSPRDRWADLTPAQRKAYLDRLTDEQVALLAANMWEWLARPEQLEPLGDWIIWLILSGRGWGKTRTGSETLTKWVRNQPTAPDGNPAEYAIIAETFSDCRIICVEGPSGLLNVLDRLGLKRGTDYTYNRSAWQIQFTETGTKIHMFGADDTDAGRGFNLSGVWADEVAKWRYPYATWNEGIAPSLRIGHHPKAIVTTTPKPTPLLIDWTRRTDGSVFITRGSTFDNARNLSATALHELKARYEGTRIGRQELYGELLDMVEGALWNRPVLDAHRYTEAPPLGRIVVAIDPAVSAHEDSDETGIVVAGTVLGTQPAEFVVLDDVSGRYQPHEWATLAATTADKWGADAIVAETNQGGDLVQATLTQAAPWARYKPVYARHTKRVRAEPVAALYEQGRVHHVGVLSRLEDQMVSWVPERVNEKSPDRIDALVWALHDLALSTTQPARKVRT